METLQIRDAKASFSAMVAAAEKRHPTLVSRHGQPCAMILPVSDGARLYPLEIPNLANDLLVQLPGSAYGFGMLKFEFFAPSPRRSVASAPTVLALAKAFVGAEATDLQKTVPS
jgi:antitoxin Phd